MNQPEFKKRMAEAEQEYKKKKFAIQKEFAESNNTIKIGDIIEDHFQRIKVGSIAIVLYGRKPECAYKGTRLTKSNKPFKSGGRGTVWQCNLKRVVSKVNSH